MINTFSGIYQIECNMCGGLAEEDFDSFREAVEYKKDKNNGWISRKNELDEWEDICEECKKNMD